MIDTKKFLDQQGVSTLWSRIAEEIAKIDNKTVKNAEDITELQSKVGALEEGTYDDSALRGLISDNAAAIIANKVAHEANTAAIEVLNGSGEGSVSKIATDKVTEILANAGTDLETLKDLAEWLQNDTTGAADMANKIATLTALVGDESVATQIANAIAEENLDQYALATDLADLIIRVSALENVGSLGEDAINNAIDSKIAALKLDETYDKKGAAATAEANAKAFVASEVNAKIIALSADEIEAAILEATV